MIPVGNERCPLFLLGSVTEVVMHVSSAFRPLDSLLNEVSLFYPIFIVTILFSLEKIAYQIN